MTHFSEHSPNCVSGHGLVP